MWHQLLKKVLPQIWKIKKIFKIFKCKLLEISDLNNIDWWSKSVVNKFET